jgi:hypothetical protein
MMKKVTVMVMVMVMAVSGFAGELRKSLVKSESGKYYGSLVIHDYRYKSIPKEELWDNDRCNRELRKIKELPDNEKDEMAISYKMDAYLHVFDMCSIDIDHTEYQKFLEWTDTVIKEDERDNFKGECLYLERELTISLERMTAVALVLEYISGLDSTEEIEREKIQQLRKALYNAKRADRLVKMTLDQCSDQAAPATINDLKRSNFTMMVLTGGN